MIGVFALDLAVLFFASSKFSLIPMYLLIKSGRANRVGAAFRSSSTPSPGSALMLVAILVVYFNTGTFNLLEMDKPHRPGRSVTWAFLAFALAFAIKVPIFPFQHLAVLLDARASPHRRAHHPGRRLPEDGDLRPALRHSALPGGGSAPPRSPT